MSNNLPEMPPKKPQTEEHKLNALAKEFQTSMVISQNPYNPLSNSMANTMPYQNYYPPRYPNYNNYGYSGYNSYPGIPYNYGAGQSNPGMEEYYQMEKNSFVCFFSFSLFFFSFFLFSLFFVCFSFFLFYQSILLCVLFDFSFSL